LRCVRGKPPGRVTSPKLHGAPYRQQKVGVTHRPRVTHRPHVTHRLATPPHSRRQQPNQAGDCVRSSASWALAVPGPHAQERHRHTLMALPAHQALTAPTARTVQTARTAYSALTAPTLQTARTVLIACASWAACDSRCCCLRCARVRTPRAGGTFPVPGAAARRMTGQRGRTPRRCPC
jgi:hypothetical protein